MNLTHSKLFRFFLIMSLFFFIIFFWPYLVDHLHNLWLFIKAVFSPFVFAAILAYVLHPMVGLISRFGLSSAWSITIVYAFFICFGVIVVTLALPTLEEQLEQLVKQFPSWIIRFQASLHLYHQQGEQNLPSFIWEGIEHSLDRVEESLSKWIERLIMDITGLLDRLLTILLVPFLSFYMLKDAALFERYIFRLFNNVHRQKVLNLLSEIDHILGHYIRGQLFICFLVFIATYIGYIFIGLPYALLLASIVGIANIIPYIGPLIGAFPALVVSFLFLPELLIGVIIVNLIVQIIEGNIISPNVIGRTLDLHPLSVILSLLIGGELGGITGLLFAVPIMAMSKVIFCHFSEHYLKKWFSAYLA